ncbi:MAG: hypothetical protein P4L79_11030 [Legionella sp.]|uniref:ATP-dependent DNA ligase n=1 Tax=Legionella sp. TaxID=459 RepID=UPI002841AC6A|nr:hypothetical protein [Legionella sp.]
MFTSSWLYSKDSLGKIRQWKYEVDGDSWRTVSGQVDGKHVISAWTKAVPKNVGRANATTPEEQALFEGNAEYNKKLEREYRISVEELDAVPVSPMLAQDYKKQKSIKFPIWSQPKLDGIRSLTFKHGSFTREFKRHMNCEHITEALVEVFARYPNIILDGELYNHDAHDDFNKITSVVRKSKNITLEDRQLSKEFIQYHVYDMVSDDDFSVRTHKVAEILDGVSPYIKIVPSVLCLTQEILDSLQGSYITDGYEGQIVRIGEGAYDAGKRSKRLLKRKEFITEEFELLEVNEGVGNWAGYAKSCKFRLPDGTTNDSGMRGNQAFAKSILENKDRYIWQTVTVRHFGYTADGKIRFPVIIDFGNRID